MAAFARANLPTKSLPARRVTDPLLAEQASIPMLSR